MVKDGWIDQSPEGVAPSGPKKKAGPFSEMKGSTFVDGENPRKFRLMSS